MRFYSITILSEGEHMARTWFVGPDGTLWPTNGEHPLPQEETFKRWDPKDKGKAAKSIFKKA